MKSRAEHQTSCPPGFFKQLILSMTVLLSIISPCSGSILSPTFLLLSVMLVFTVAVFLNLTKREKVFEDASAQEEAVLTNGNREETPLQVEDDKMVLVGQAHDDECVVSSPSNSFRSESAEDFSFSTDSSVVDWHLGFDLDQAITSSDGSISDEESLIEIALPDGHYKKDSDMYKLPKFGMNLLDYLPESVLRQHGLMELFSEINEDDNLIEIDLSLGSIKCSPLEIKA